MTLQRPEDAPTIIYCHDAFYDRYRRQQLLGREGIAVRSASSPEALRERINGDPAIVLLSATPMDGYTPDALARTIREWGVAAHVVFADHALPPGVDTTAFDGVVISSVTQQHLPENEDLVEKLTPYLRARLETQARPTV